MEQVHRVGQDFTFWTLAPTPAHFNVLYSVVTVKMHPVCHFVAEPASSSSIIKAHDWPKLPVFVFLPVLGNQDQ